MLLLSVAAAAEERAHLEAVTRELLEPLGVRVQLRAVSRVDTAELRRAAGRPYFARAWLAFSADGAARLYLEHGASDRLLLRDVPGNPTNPELVREELGHILQAAVEGLKAGEEIGAPRQQVLQQVAPEPPPVVVPPREPSPPPSKPPQRARLRFGVRYEARWLGDGARFEDGPGVLLQWGRRIGLELNGYYRRPLTAEAEPVGARLRAVSLRALLTVQTWRTAESSLRFGAGLGPDFVRVEPLTTGARSLELTEATWRTLALGRLQATCGYRVSSWLELELSAGVDLDASGTRYVLERSTGQDTVLAPSPARPFLSLGVALP